MGCGRGAKGCSVAIIIPPALPMADTSEGAMAATGEGAMAATGEGAMVAMELLRESVLGARQGSPRHGKRCVKFDLEGARLLHQKLHEATQKRDQGGALRVEVKRIEVLGSRHGTPPRTWGFPGVPDKVCTTQQVQQERETRKASSEKLPQSSSVQVQRLVTALQLAPRRSQSCAATSEGLLPVACISPLQSPPSPCEEDIAMATPPLLSFFTPPPLRASSQAVSPAASSPLAPSPSSCLPPLSSPPSVSQSLRKPSLRASRPGSWTVPTHLLHQEERREAANMSGNQKGLLGLPSEKAELMSCDSRDCPSQGDVWPRSGGTAQPELQQRARRVARKAVSERLPQGSLHLKEGLGIQGSSEALGLFEAEQSEFREWRPRGTRSTQSFHSSPVHRSPRRGVEGIREADNASPRHLQAPTRTSSLGTPSQSRPTRLLDRKRILGARMTLDEQTLRYYAGNH